MLELYPYQKEGINTISRNYAAGIRRQIFQLPTGGGKTVVFSGMVRRYLSAFSRKNVLILVHREELLNQSRTTLYNHFNILSEPITAKNKNIGHAQVYVGMVETVYNRIKKYPHLFNNIGMLIIDECHIGNFKKIYEHFPDSLIVGFSATPLSSSKKDPLKNYFDEIVTGPQITEIIQRGKLSTNETFSVKGINRRTLRVKRGEFDNRQMQQVYSKSRNVKNVVKTYEKLCGGKKTIVFNVNVEHSKLVNQAFIDAGYDARHLDGTETKTKRAELLKWFKYTPNAILNNIGVLTTGFDEPSIRNVIVNRSTMSLTLWLQMTGRGGRTFPGKEFFRIIDMGGNVLVHGDWRSDRDWYDIFHNPDKPSQNGGVAPIKSCEKCEAIIPAQAVTCSFCGHVHERIINYDMVEPTFKLIVGRMNVQQLVEETQRNGHKEWKTFFQILDKTITTLKYKIGDVELTDEILERAYQTFEEKVIEWRRTIKKPYTRHIKEFARQKFEEDFYKLRDKLKIA